MIRDFEDFNKGVEVAAQDLERRAGLWETGMQDVPTETPASLLRAAASAIRLLKQGSR